MRDKTEWSNAKYIWKNRREPEIKPIFRILVAITVIALAVIVGVQMLIYFGLLAVGAPWLIAVVLAWGSAYPVADVTTVQAARFIAWWLGPNE